MLDGTTIAAILTGILALFGAVATAWMSGLNENRKESRKNRKQLSRYSVPLLIASWDLANWLYDILEDDNYSPERCDAYGNGWTKQFNSYLFGQYFAGVHIIREKTQFFAGLGGSRSQELKKLLWKIQDEFVSMHYEGRENHELRWVEYDILHVQEAMTVADGDELRPMQWREFKQNYAVKEEPGAEKDRSMELKRILEPYEDELQRIIFRRFHYLYSATTEPTIPKDRKPEFEGKPKWLRDRNPQSLEASLEHFKRKRDRGTLTDKEYDAECRKVHKDDKMIKKELEEDLTGATVVVIPDHRVRRLQHLLSDLVTLLDEVSSMKFNRPARRCKMDVDRRVLSYKTATEWRNEGLSRIPCDCNDDVGCNSTRLDFKHRDLTSTGWGGISRKGTLSFGSQAQTATVAGVEPDQPSLGIRRKTTDGEQC
ncbi:hypothetical protein B0T16DRAFT_419701 [Cercophora newfieldiana]|uniref:Uncharacterized protein n=1 Tax=Cercophora newfieldiana TaxID=92897 RepID=A0AA39XW59_9PEZI|nr:hypothetical protein B0T16DRAFT_419701 [Cercophora newfieldiana]